MAPTYPSVPDPRADLQSMYATVLALKQCVGLLVLNAAGGSKSQTVKSNTFLTVADGTSITEKIASTTLLLSELSAALGQLASCLSVDEVDIEALHSAVSAAQSNISSINSSLAAAQADITANTGEISTNASAIAANTSAISTLNSEVSSLNASITALNNSVTTINSTLASWGHLLSVTGTISSGHFTMTGVKSLDGTTTAAYP